MAGWGGQRGNMDPTVLAQTLVNVAQNLMNNQQQSNSGAGGFAVNRPGPWSSQGESGSGLLGEGPRNGGRSMFGEGPRGAGGLLGEGPRNSGNERRQSSGGTWKSSASAGKQQQKGGGHNTWSTEYNGKKASPTKTEGGGNRPMRPQHQQRSMTRSIDNKNYLPKIKVEGQKPHYYHEEYANIAGKYFQCTLCKKDPMWDGDSFCRHLLGNTHNQKVESLIEEDVGRVARLRKAVEQFYKQGEGLGDKKCGLCDVKVKDIIKHRKSESHKQLKQFIHPHCEPCGADMEDRVDWYYHKFSAYHLSSLDMCGASVNYTPISSSDIDAVIEKMENRVGGKKRKMDDNKVKVEEKADVKMDADDDVIIMDDENNATAAAEEDDIVGDVVGAEYIKPVKGLFCKLCKKFFPSDKSEVEAHCSSSQHMDSVSLIEKQTGIKRKPAAEFFE